MPNRKPPKPPKAPPLRTHEGGARNEYPQESKEHVVRAVLWGAMTALEATRQYKEHGLTTAQIDAWIGKALRENWSGIRDDYAAFLRGDGDGGPKKAPHMESFMQRPLTAANSGDTSTRLRQLYLSDDQLSKLAQLLGDGDGRERRKR
jgi:hypothetical protein